ncbi:MAG: C40 family peptidase [Actinobacteria bacterium]|nr:C40 family peptidase [Actinomycetota bacterium]
MAVRQPLLGRRLIAAVATVVLAFTAVALGSSSGMAAPQADIQEVEAQVRDLEMQAGAAHEEASRAADRLAAARQKLDSVQGRLQSQRNELNQSQAVLADLARSLYASGGIDPALELLLAEDPVEFLAQASVMDQVASIQAAQIRQAQTGRLRLAQTEAEASDQEAQAEALEAEMRSAEARVTERLGRAKSILANLRQEDRERLARIQEERVRQQREEARQAAAAAAAQTPASGDSGSSGQGGGATSPDGSADSGGGYSGESRAQAAVQYALAQVGEPYSYSARPPDSWDCSKLTSSAWAKSGVGLTALSFTQWDQTQRVPVSQIQPGDLVFYFGSGAHHVAIYVGNGKMVSASNPSDGVEIIDFLGPWYKERFSGVGRVIG